MRLIYRTAKLLIQSWSRHERETEDKKEAKRVEQIICLQE